ncbi:MAG: catalase, partial [Deltaproteobacteria bacterium]
MSKKPILTNEAGNPVFDNQHSQTAGPRGPVLLQDQHLIEKLARFNRERIPERVVHAVGTGAYGSFECTAEGLERYTSMRMLSKRGKRTETFVRFSTVLGSKGAPDAVRDPRGFAIKFYTEDGNWDLVGNNTPIFFIRDGIKFPDFIHSQKYDPFTNRREPNNIFDFFSHTPEATHQFTWLFGDRGIPASYRHMDGFGGHAFLWTNQAGEQFYVKFHFITDSGIKCRSEADAHALGGSDAEALQHDFYTDLQKKAFPTWTASVQIMPAADVAKQRFDPFDLTKVWRHKDFPLHQIGKLTLNRLPDNYFAHTEQAAFSPANMVPGIGPSPDRVLQARLFGYADAQRYRLGINHTSLPVNRAQGCPHAVRNYGRDGAMRHDDNGGDQANYHPNSVDGPDATGQHYDMGYALGGQLGYHPPQLGPEDNDFSQAGALYRLYGADGQARLIDSLSTPLSEVTRPG